MKFTVKETEYLIDHLGVVHQLNPQPYTYDEKYSAVYDSPQYTKQSDILQALRFSFMSGAHGKPVKSLIDVGYGNGAFMKFAKQQVQIVGGLDVTGVAVPEGCYKAEDFDKVDVVTFFDCLEHIPDLMFVRDIPAETIIISLPYCHIKEKGVSWFENEYYHLKINEHLHHFDEESLVKFMDNMGWYSVAISTLEDIVRKRGEKNILTAAFKRKEEKWMPVIDWEDKYMVSSFGRVKSLARKIGWGKGYWSAEKILQEQKDPDGYRQISFPTANRKSMAVKIHQLVARHFVSNPDDKPVVNHKNGVRHHNYASNLEWVTMQENVLHGFKHNGRKVENITTRKPIIQFDLDGNVIKVWPSGLSLAKEANYDRSSIAQAILKNKIAYGCKWAYASKNAEL